MINARAIVPVLARLVSRERLSRARDNSELSCSGACRPMVRPTISVCVKGGVVASVRSNTTINVRIVDVDDLLDCMACGSTPCGCRDFSAALRHDEIRRAVVDHNALPMQAW